MHRPTERLLPFLSTLLGVLLLHRGARASLGDEPALDPRMEMDPRIELDPRIDRPDPPPRRSGGSRVHAPLWFSIGVSGGTVAKGVPCFGGELQVGLPLERLYLRSSRAAIAQESRPPPKPDARAANDPRHKLDLAPPPPPPKLVAPAAPAPEPPLVVPVVVTSDMARAAVDAALRHAHLIDSDARIDELASRARRAAGLPELRLRVLRTADEGQTLSPVSYDPSRIVAVDTINFWAEARATWRLDRALFAEDEVALERMRYERADAKAHLTKEVVRVLFEWQRAVAQAANAFLPAEERLAAELRALESAAEVDVLTDGWLGRYRLQHPELAPPDATARRQKVEKPASPEPADSTEPLRR